MFKCDKSFLCYLLEKSKFLSGKFQRILRPVASGMENIPKDKFLLHGFLCNSGMTIPLTAPSKKPTASSDGK